MFLEISQYSQENTCARDTFLIKLQAWILLQVAIFEQIWDKKLHFWPFVMQFLPPNLYR